MMYKCIICYDRDKNIYRGRYKVRDRDRDRDRRRER